ncbi:hypothetical protein IWQ48_000851 [Labrenzia sp. EL_13]|nr:hypothetical protein [Labrenzia sp. EL_13]
MANFPRHIGNNIRDTYSPLPARSKPSTCLAPEGNMHQIEVAYGEIWGAASKSSLFHPLGHKRISSGISPFFSGLIKFIRNLT